MVNVKIVERMKAAATVPPPSNESGEDMIDLKKIGKFFESRNLWDKPFNQWSRNEMLSLAEAFFNAPGLVPFEGFAKPFIDRDGWLKVPFDCHPKYQWWKPGGMSGLEILRELGASEEVIEQNRPVGYDSNGVSHS